MINSKSNKARTQGLNSKTANDAESIYMQVCVYFCSVCVWKVRTLCHFKGYTSTFSTTTSHTRDTIKPSIDQGFPFTPLSLSSYTYDAQCPYISIVLYSARPAGCASVRCGKPPLTFPQLDWLLGFLRIHVWFRLPCCFEWLGFCFLTVDGGLDGEY